MLKKINALVVASLSLVTFAVHAGDGDKVSRSERTGKKAVMEVGECILKHNRDIDGNIKLGYEFYVTYCVEYSNFQAIQRGKGWNAKYEPISDATYSYKVNTDTESFSNFFSSNTVFDEALVQISLYNQCLSKKEQLENLTDYSNPCK